MQKNLNAEVRILMSIKINIHMQLQVLTPIFQGISIMQITATLS